MLLDSHLDLNSKKKQIYKRCFIIVILISFLRFNDQLKRTGARRMFFFLFLKKKMKKEAN